MVDGHQVVILVPGAQDLTLVAILQDIQVEVAVLILEVGAAQEQVMGVQVDYRVEQVVPVSL